MKIIVIFLILCAPQHVQQAGGSPHVALEEADAHALDPLLLDALSVPARESRENESDDEAFKEWRQRMQQAASLPYNLPLKQDFAINYANNNCGAQILESSKKTEHASAILTAQSDSYMLHPCGAPMALTIQLCDSVLVQRIVLANFELFSSTLETMRVFVSDSFPATSWRLVDTLHLKDIRQPQQFDIAEPVMFSKYVRLEADPLPSGEFYCPISTLAIFGTSMIEEFNAVQQQQQKTAPDADTAPDTPAPTTAPPPTSRPTLRAVADAIVSIFTRSNTGPAATATATIATSITTSETAFKSAAVAGETLPSTAVPVATTTTTTTTTTTITTTTITTATTSADPAPTAALQQPIVSAEHSREPADVRESAGTASVSKPLAASATGANVPSDASVDPHPPLSSAESSIAFPSSSNAVAVSREHSSPTPSPPHDHQLPPPLSTITSTTTPTATDDVSPLPAPPVVAMAVPSLAPVLALVAHCVNSSASCDCPTRPQLLAAWTGLQLVCLDQQRSRLALAAYHNGITRSPAAAGATATAATATAIAATFAAAAAAAAVSTMASTTVTILAAGDATSTSAAITDKSNISDAAPQINAVASGETVPAAFLATSHPGDTIDVSHNPTSRTGASANNLSSTAPFRDDQAVQATPALSSATSAQTANSNTPVAAAAQPATPPASSSPSSPGAATTGATAGSLAVSVSAADDPTTLLSNTSSTNANNNSSTAVGHESNLTSSTPASAATVATNATTLMAKNAGNSTTPSAAPNTTKGAVRGEESVPRLGHHQESIFVQLLSRIQAVERNVNASETFLDRLSGAYARLNASQSNMVANVSSILSLLGEDLTLFSQESLSVMKTHTELLRAVLNITDMMVAHMQQSAIAHTSVRDAVAWQGMLHNVCAALLALLVIAVGAVVVLLVRLQQTLLQRKF